MHNPAPSDEAPEHQASSDTLNDLSNRVLFHNRLERSLEKRGFRVVRQGKHITLSDGATMVQLPRHTVINAYTMGYIAKVAGLTPDQFRALL